MAKIRIVDDDVELSQDLAALLEANGHAVTVANSTRDIVQQMAVAPPDLLILDVMFPDNPVAGFDVARKVHSHRKLREIPIILLSAVNKEFPTNFSSADIDGTWLQVQDFLEKPVSSPVLLEKVALLLKESAPTRSV